jgi:hypothetical protein
MSSKKPNASSTCTQSAKSETHKMTAIQPKPEKSSSPSSLELVASSSSISPLAKVYASPAFQLAWDNNLATQIAMNVLHLRRFRHYSQSRVARDMGTSQSKIARIESGDENITIGTLMRLVGALGGRIRFGIEPKEAMLPRVPNWWEVLGTGLASDCAWTLNMVVTDDDGAQVRALAGWTTSSSQAVTAQHVAELKVAATELLEAPTDDSDDLLEVPA